MNKKKYFCFIFFITFSMSSVSSDQECFAKKIQIMKPEYPAADISGFNTISFDIDKNGFLKNIRSLEGKCLLKNKTKEYEFRPCGIFKKYAIAAATSFRYSKPIKKNGESCVITNQTHRFTFIKDNSETTISTYKKALDAFDSVTNTKS
jgi:hypothetical protein